MSRVRDLTGHVSRHPVRILVDRWDIRRPSAAAVIAVGEGRCRQAQDEEVRRAHLVDRWGGGCGWAERSIPTIVAFCASAEIG